MKYDCEKINNIYLWVCEKKGKNSDKLETKKGEWKTPLEKNPSSEKPKIVYICYCDIN